jgi:hypothetical protein
MLNDFSPASSGSEVKRLQLGQEQWDRRDFLRLSSTGLLLPKPTHSFALCCLRRYLWLAAQCPATVPLAWQRASAARRESFSAVCKDHQKIIILMQRHLIPPAGPPRYCPVLQFFVTEINFNV